MDLNVALKWVDAAVSNHAGHSLREPEIVILRGTWRGLTYEQMANDSEYSTNYLMRDVAPKLWKQLSVVFERSVGKTNFRVALESYAATNASLLPDILSMTSADLGVYDSVAQDAGASSISDEALAVAARRRESEQGWLKDGVNLWGAVGASLLSASSILPGVMYGYATPLSQLSTWLGEAAEAEGRSHLIGVWGLRGVGKTLLVETAAAQVGDRFEGLIWRSLQDQPTLSELSVSILASLGMAAPPSQATFQLLNVLSSRSLLIVLEGAEALLASESLAGDYLPEYQNYGEFFQSMMSTRSSVVITGIEAPSDLLRQGGYGGNEGVRSLTLSGLSSAAAMSLLEAERLLAADYWPELIERYQGHPLALKSVARVIRELFNGRVDAFLRQSSVLFNGIFRLLSPSFDRLSLPEINILYWMASYESALSLDELQQSLPLAFTSSELISALDSLKQRSLINIQRQVEPPTFALPALVKVYAVHQFMGQFASERDALNFRWPGAASAPLTAALAAAPVDAVINLSPVSVKPVKLSHWLQGQFDADWHSLDWLFESALRPAMRLRSAYHLRDETFVKRCKPISFGSPAFGSPAFGSPALGSSDLDLSVSDELSMAATSKAAKAVLLVAINQDSEAACQVCVQAQPDRADDVLPQSLVLNLLDVNQHVLATVTAGPSDTFIQLPYFRGDINETFVIELLLSGVTCRETFVI